MSHVRGALIGVLLLLASGCRSVPHTTTVVEYRPRDGPVERPAPYSDVYLLWQWVPQDPSAHPTEVEHAVSRQVPFEVGHTYATRGSPLGFRLINGQLVAVAGATTQPLVEAHYTWQSLPGASQAASGPPPSNDLDQLEGDDSVVGFFHEMFFDGFDSASDSLGEPGNNRNYDDRHEREKLDSWNYDYDRVDVDRRPLTSQP